MNPIDSSHTTGTPNPLARTPKTTTDSATQVPGLSKEMQGTSATLKSNSAKAQDVTIGVKKPASESAILQIANKQTRAQEVEKTRQLIAQGAYTVDLGKLADAMLKKQVIQ